MTEPLRHHGDHGGATAVYAVQAPQWHRASGVTGLLHTYQLDSFDAAYLLACSCIPEAFELSIHMVFVDLEKAFDRVPRDLIWWSMRKKGIPEQYVAIIQDMYKDTQTRVKTRSDTTEYFDI